MARRSDAETNTVNPLRSLLVLPYKTNRRFGILRGAMTNFVSEFDTSIDIEALVTTLKQLLPGFEQAYGKNYADLKQRYADEQANKAQKQSSLADPLVETIRELAEDR